VLQQILQGGGSIESQAVIPISIARRGGILLIVVVQLLLRRLMLLQLLLAQIAGDVRGVLLQFLQQLLLLRLQVLLLLRAQHLFRASLSQRVLVMSQARGAGGRMVTQALVVGVLA